MTLFHLFLVAVIQGLTEFLPVSSSGHLILLPNLTGMQDQGQAIDVAVHVGTLGAVILYFWRDVRIVLGGVPRLVQGRIDTPGARLAFLLMLATIPVTALGLTLKLTGLDVALRSVTVIGWTMLGFGLVLYWADQKGAPHKTASDWSTRDAWILGLWQAIALIPGTSRSGIVITGARFLGYERSVAARISMLMSIPTIIASGVLLGAEVVGEADWEMLRLAGIGAVFAFGAALLALSLMMRLLRSVSFTPYVVYRVVLGMFLIWWGYTA
ncbi:undecaprenyl-diphosphate phosphatase [Primorskyibacter aestuariivivens]|uniref:undecaprenyl-diphosphate phosphatase n=1 Tax=Primorskyibacter aestuariivivens TaxID=1888912 RepID=UPI002301A4C8|nr:undecaprenyl-diphosphate phosphatase [Primorskyibacter aestuariivivens]MDA7429515.1 undecaprenyl-diphosphate phosphatase [Primorskyibacter aestuariivivens]